MARYDSLRKLQRNKDMVDYRAAHPEESLQEIADIFHVSRERVRMILKAAKVNTTPYKDIK